MNYLDSKIPEIRHFFNLQQLSWPFTQKLRNSSVLYQKTKNLFEAKICMKSSFQLL